MDILQALAGLNPPKPTNDRVLCDDGMLSVESSVFYIALWGAGLDKEIIDDWMLEPPENRHIVLKRIGIN